MYLIDKIENPMIRETVDWIFHIGIAIIIALLITTFIFQRTVVNKISMMPTLSNGDNLIVEKISPRLDKLKKGDIITIYAPEQVHEEGSTIIKRIIGMEGDRIEIKDGKVYVNDAPITEPYINGNYTKATGEYCKMTVPKGQLYFLGDNRVANILDSRSMGTVPISAVTGKAIFRLFPFNAMRTF